MHTATSSRVAITPTKAPNNGVSCTKTAVDDAVPYKIDDIVKYVRILFYEANLDRFWTHNI